MKKLFTCTIFFILLLIQPISAYAAPKVPYKVILPPQYENIALEVLPNGDAYFLAQKDQLWGVFDADGQEILPCQYQDISGNYLDYGYLHVETGGQWLLLDQNLQAVFPGEYDNCIPLPGSDGLFKVARNNLWGVADQNNTLIIPIKYRDIGQVYPREDGGWWLNAYTKKDYVVIDQNNTLLFSTELLDYSYPSSFTSFLSGRWLVTADHPTGAGLSDYYNVYDVLTGELVAYNQGHGPATNPLKPSDDGLIFTVNGKSVLDKNGTVLVAEGQFDFIGAFLKGRAVASKDGQEYIIDASGNILAQWQPTIYDQSDILKATAYTISPEHGYYDFNDGYNIFTNEKYGYIILKKQGLQGVWDAGGNELLPYGYNEIAVAGKDRFIVMKEESPALITAAGEFLIPFGQYDAISYLFADFFLCSNGDKKAVFNSRTGKEENMGFTSFSLLSNYYRNDLLAQVYNEQNETALANANGSIIVPFGEYNYFGESKHPSYIYISLDDKAGYIRVEPTLFQTASFAPSFWAEELLSQAAGINFVPLYHINGYQNHLTKDDFFILLHNITIQKTGHPPRDLYYNEFSYGITDIVMPQDLYYRHWAYTIYPFIMEPQNEPSLFYPDEPITKEEICLLLEQLAAALGCNIPQRGLYIDESLENLQKTATWEEAIVIAYKFYLALA